MVPEGKNGLSDLSVDQPAQSCGGMAGQPAPDTRVVTTTPSIKLIAIIIGSFSIRRDNSCKNGFFFVLLCKLHIFLSLMEPRVKNKK